MAKTSVINIRTDIETKQAIEDLYSAFGISVSDAVNIFFKKSLMQNGLPFTMEIPRLNDETIAAIAEGERLLADPNTKRYSSFTEILEEAKNEI